MYREVFGGKVHDLIHIVRKAFGALARQPRNQIGIDDRNAAFARRFISGIELLDRVAAADRA